MTALTVLELDTERGWRGGERHVLWHAEGLARLGHRVLIGARPGEPLAERARAAGFGVVPCHPRFEFDPLAALRLRRTILREGVQVVHAHAAHAVATGAMATAGTDARLVVTRHQDIPLRRNAGTRWKYARASAILAISEASRRALLASGIAPERIEVSHGGTDQEREMPPADRATLAALGIPEGAPLVVQVSQLVGHKDPLTFVDAIAEAHRAVPTLHAVLVGDGPLRAEVERAVAARALQGVLRVAGYRTDADALLAAADVVTMSSRTDALPIVLFDALYAGRAIAATAGGGIPEIVEHDVSGLLVPVGDGRALGAAIARLLGDRALASRLAEGARRRAPHFSMRAVVERAVRTYQRILA